MIFSTYLSRVINLLTNRQRGAVFQTAKCKIWGRGVLQIFPLVNSLKRLTPRALGFIVPSIHRYQMGTSTIAEQDTLPQGLKGFSLETIVFYLRSKSVFLLQYALLSPPLPPDWWMASSFSQLPKENDLTNQTEERSKHIIDDRIWSYVFDKNAKRWLLSVIWLDWKPVVHTIHIMRYTSDVAP